MKEEIMLPNNKIKAEGKIIIEYTNGETGEVENRYESENHAFPAGFLRLNNYALSTSSFSILLSDKGDDINYDIPVIPGNIIGYGSQGSSAQGILLGAENINARNLGMFTDGKWHYKRQWSWLPSQVTSEIKSFGISPYEASGSNYSDKYHMCPYQLPFNGKVDNSRYGSLVLFDHGVSYSVGNMYFYGTTLQSSSVSVYSTEEEASSSSKSFTSLIPIPSDVGNTSNSYFNSSGSSMMAIDLDTDDLLVMVLYKTTSGEPKVQITRLDTNLTVMKSNTIYNCGTYTSSGYPFYGYQGRSFNVGYYTKGKFYTLYGESDTGFCQVAEINPSKWSESGNFIDAFSFTDTPHTYSGYKPHSNGTLCLSLKNGYPIFYTSYSRSFFDLTQNATSSPCCIFMDPQTNKAYASKYIYVGDSNNRYFGYPFMEKINNTNVILQHLSYYYGNPYIDGESNYYRNLSDYTLYVLPDNAPKREEGQGVTITYEIAWGYEEDN